VEVSQQPLPLVSVIITSRNRIRFLPRALETVYAQDYPNSEILVLDDASDDGTSGYVRSHYPEVRLFRFENNQGLVAGRNLLMREARGEYIISLDDDAYFSNKDAISKVVERMRREPEIGVITLRVIERESEEFSPPGTERYTNDFLGGAHCTRKGVLAHTGAYREFLFRQGEESDLALRLLDKGYRILYFPGAVVVHDASPVGRDLNRMLTDAARNHLLRSWINEPFPWWIVTTTNSIVKCLAVSARRGWVLKALEGFWSAIKEWPRIRSQRQPVSNRAMRLYFALRQRRVADTSEVQRLYESPPSFWATLLHQMDSKGKKD
jgi:GT2 family glycosyltransferase